MIGNDAGELRAGAWAKAVRETDRLCYELDITNADHIVLWLEHQLNGHVGPLAYIACRILDAHEAAMAGPDTTPASAGVLVEAAKAVVADYPVAAGTYTDLEGADGKPGYGSIRRLAQALSTTAMPASDGEAKLDQRCGFGGGSVLEAPKSPEWLAACERLAERFDHWKMPDRAAQIRAGHPGWLIEQACVEAMLAPTTTTPTPDRFGEGYRAGVEASAKVAQHVREIIGAATGSSIGMALAEASDRIRALRPIEKEAINVG